MLEVPVYNTEGKQIQTLQIEEAVFGSVVNPALIKQAVVGYHANRRQHSAANKGRSDVRGGTLRGHGGARVRKAYRQKGTGRARRGDLKTNILRGGGVAFAKRPIVTPKRLPKKMRRAALKSAILAKILGSDLMVLDGLAMAEPRTRRMAQVLRSLQVDRSCLLALAERDPNVYLSCRNIPALTVRTVEELNAFDVATRRKMVVTSQAMKALVQPEEQT